MAIKSAMQNSTVTQGGCLLFLALDIMEERVFPGKVFVVGSFTLFDVGKAKFGEVHRSFFDLACRTKEDKEY